MNKHKFKYLFIIILFLFNITPLNAKTDYTYITSGYQDYLEDQAKDFPSVKSHNILLYNLDEDKVLYAKNSTDKISIASLTKIMTALVAIENIPDLNSQVTVTKKAFEDTKEYSLAGFKVGDKVTYLDLLYGTILPSGAEAATQLALSVSKTIPDFALLMNEKAKSLGMTNTSYSNPIGRDDPNNYSTLEDLSKLLKYALTNEAFSKIYTSKSYTTTNNLTFDSTLKTAATRYKLNVTNILGSKSGYTDAAGLCLSSIATYNGVNYLLLTANAPYSYGNPLHVKDAINIYNYYFTNYQNTTVLKKDTLVQTLKIKDAFTKEYSITSPEDIILYLKNDLDQTKLKYTYNGIDTLTSKVKTNSKLGTITISYENNVLYTYPVYLTTTIKYKHTKLFLTLLALILIFVLILKKKLSTKKGRKKHGHRSKK